MSTRHVKSPRAPFSFLSYLLSDALPPFLLFGRAAGFLPPRPCIPCIVAGRRAQMLSRLAALQRPHPPGASAFTAIEHDGRLDGSGRLITPVCYLSLSVFVSARVISITDVAFGRSCYEVHGPCDNRINLYPAAPIRLAKVLLAWTIAQEMGLIFRTADWHFANLRCAPTATHPTRPTHDWAVGTQHTVDIIA
jgi:hypothetical protein